MKGGYASASKNPREREERRAGPSGFEDTFDGKISMERNMRGKTNTGSEIALKRKPYSTLAVSLGGNSEIKPTSNTLYDFYRIIAL